MFYAKQLLKSYLHGALADSKGKQPHYLLCQNDSAPSQRLAVSWKSYLSDSLYPQSRGEIRDLQHSFFLVLLSINFGLGERKRSAAGERKDKNRKDLDRKLKLLYQVTEH